MAAEREIERELCFNRFCPCPSCEAPTGKGKGKEKSKGREREKEITPRKRDCS